MEGPKNTKTVPDTFVFSQKKQKRFLTPLFYQLLITI